MVHGVECPPRVTQPHVRAGVSQDEGEALGGGVEDPGGAVAEEAVLQEHYWPRGWGGEMMS